MLVLLPQVAYFIYEPAELLVIIAANALLALLNGASCGTRSSRSRSE